MNKRNMKLSPPWEEIHSMLQTFFESDSEVAVDREISEDCTLGVVCYSAAKFNALDVLLRKQYEFGNVTFRIDVCMPADSAAVASGDDDPAKLMKTALEGNQLFDKIVIRNIMMSKICYCVFKKEVIQFYNDDLTDLYGYESTLAENIARIIFDVEDINFCTEVDQK